MSDRTPMMKEYLGEFSLTTGDVFTTHSRMMALEIKLVSVSGRILCFLVNNSKARTNHIPYQYEWYDIEEVKQIITKNKMTGLLTDYHIEHTADDYAIVSDILVYEVNYGNSDKYEVRPVQVSELNSVSSAYHGYSAAHEEAVKRNRALRDNNELIEERHKNTKRRATVQYIDEDE